MQAQQHYLVEPVLDRPHRPHTDDEMLDPDMDRKDDDLDLLDVSSNVGGVDLEDGSIIMEEDYLDTAPQTYDNDDLMIDEVEENEEDMLFHLQQQQKQQSPIPPVSSSTSLDTSEPGQNQSQDNLRPQSAQAAGGDTPLFSFTRPNDSTHPHSISFAVPEKSSVPDHSLYEDAPTEPLAVIEETTSAAIQPLDSNAKNAANLNTDVRSRHSQSPAEVAEEVHAAPDNLTEDVHTADSVELDNDFQHNGGWSENTSTTLAHEPNLLEDQRTFEDEDEEEGDNHVGNAGTEAEGRSPTGFAVEEFPQYNLHPIVVEWEKNRLSLFPTPNPVAEESDLEFFIQDPQVCEKGINELFQEFRKVLDGSVSRDVELFIEFEGLGLELGEDNVSCNSISLQYILNLHVQLHRQDGVENPDPLRINLFTRPSFSNQITSLVAAATQGMGFLEAVGSIEVSAEDSHMKTEEEHTGSDAHTPNEGFDQGDVHEAQSHSEDQKDLEERQSAEPEDPCNPNSNLTTPRALENNDEKLVEIKDEKGQGSVEAKIEEDDDDEFDLEYGTEENQETGQEGSEAGGVELNADDTESTPESSSGSETPKPATRLASEEVTTSVQIESTEVPSGDILDGVSPQRPEETEDTESNVEADHSPSIYEDEELIEYEEDDETVQQPVTADAPTKDTNEHQSTKSDAFSPVLDHPQPSGSPLVHEIQKSESPNRPSSHGSDHVKEALEKGSRSSSLAKADESNTNENEDVSAGPKVPSSIPVFQGDDGPEDEYEYADDQRQQVYNRRGYDDQAQQFQTEEREYEGERAVFEDNPDDNLQDPEYFEGDFEYNADYPSDGQNEYLDGGENELPGDVDGYDHFAGDDDDIYNELGEQEYPAKDENGYPIEYPHEDYDGDAAAYYQHEEFGDADVKTAAGDEFGVPIKGDLEHALLPSDAVDILKSSVVANQAEEEQLIDYEDDEEELTREHAHNSPVQISKSPTEQKRMREDEPEQNEYDNTGESQGLWQYSSYNGEWAWTKRPDRIPPAAKRVRSE